MRVQSDARIFATLFDRFVICSRPFIQFLLRNNRHWQRRDVPYFRRTRLSDRVLSLPFPEAPPEPLTPEIRQMVYDHLPRFEEARGACELFLNYSSYMFVVVVLVDLILLFTDESDRTSSLTREELLHILETVYQNKCVLVLLDGRPLLTFLAGAQTQSLLHITSASFLSCLLYRDCYTARTTTP